jgi:iron-sulfur cluster insertion protein
MKIAFTENAIEKLRPRMADKDKKLKLKYDTDGCGCAVSGVPALWLVDKKENDDMEIETNFVPILIERSRLVFFEEDMTIDYTDTANSFQLKSPNQILNPRMMLVEKGA